MVRRLIFRHRTLHSKLVHCVGYVYASTENDIRALESVKNLSKSNIKLLESLKNFLKFLDTWENKLIEYINYDPKEYMGFKFKEGGSI